ncbi:MAG: glutamate-5-semialdehyde dehydrogenase [Helicobacteraceae bacterium]|jgi:glutamate-5-semialdehyde dehydrogenase|nr:glutamate-5-semialdehyde dehydrogenase [Helicobacteraceae bacterium]
MTENEMREFLTKAKKAARILAAADGGARSRAIVKMAEMIEAREAAILAANAEDIEAARSAGLTEAMIDRLALSPKRIGEIARGLREIAALRDPLGEIQDGWITEDNLKIEKVSAPIGVVGVIYESRPNVTADVAALCLKSGNAAVLKGGKEAAKTNKAIENALQAALQAVNLPADSAALLPDGSREAVAVLARQSGYLDLIVPRGGEALIKFVSEHARVPIVKHDKGVCHLYLHESADYEMSEKIAINAKVQRPSACNAIETLLIDRRIAAEFLPRLAKAFAAQKTELRGCEETRGVVAGIRAADESDWSAEYLENILAIRVVSGLDEAIAHIAKFGSGHSEAIIAQNYAAIERFLAEIDAACVYANASTRFTDGGRFGFGAEVGISTNKLGARGPMGIRELTTYKYKIYGAGQTRK